MRKPRKETLSERQARERREGLARRLLDARPASEQTVESQASRARLVASTPRPAGGEK